MAIVRCPNCRAAECRRSKLKWYDLPLLCLFVGPWRCRHCSRRFWRPLIWP